MTHSPNSTAMSREAEAEALSIGDFGLLLQDILRQFARHVEASPVRHGMSVEEFSPRFEAMRFASQAIVTAASRLRSHPATAGGKPGEGERLDPRKDGLAPKDVRPSSDDVHAWISRAYRDPADASQMDAPRFTRWNMEVAFQAGFGAGHRAALAPTAQTAASGAVELREALERLAKVAGGDGPVTKSNAAMLRGAANHLSGGPLIGEPVYYAQALRERADLLEQGVDLALAALARPVAEEPAAPVEGEGEQWVFLAEQHEQRQHFERHLKLSRPAFAHPLYAVASILTTFSKALPREGSFAQSLAFLSNECARQAMLTAAPKANGVGTGGEGWRDDPSADDRWNAGLDYGQQQLCYVLNVDPQSVSWDAATETLDGDVRAVIRNILTAWAGDDWRDVRTAPTPSQGNDEGADWGLVYGGGTEA